MNNSNYPSFTVIIPAYNSEKTIEKCLKAVFDAVPNSKEVIVVDDGSTDNTSNVASRFPVILFRLKRQLGTVRAREKGLMQSNGEIIFFIDSDTIVNKNFFVNLLSALNGDRVGGVGGIVHPIKDNLISNSLEARLFGFSSIREKRIREIDSIPAGCSGYPKRVLMEVGWPEKSLVFGEDVALNFRIRKAGYKVLLVPSAKVYHYHPNSLKKLIRKWFIYGNVTVNLYRKNYIKEEEIILRLGWFFFCGFLFLIALWSMKLLFWLLLLLIFWTPWIIYYSKGTIYLLMHRKKIKFLFIPFIHQIIILSLTLGTFYGIFKVLLRKECIIKPSAWNN